MGSKVIWEGVEIRRDSRELIVRGEVKRLPWRAFDVLLLLADHAGEVVSKEQLLQTVWGGAAIDDSNITQAVAQIRKAMGEYAPGQSYIETIPRIGYRIYAPALTARVPPPMEAPVPPAPQLRPASEAVVGKRNWGLPALVLLAATVLGAAVAASWYRGRNVESELIEAPFTALEGEELSANFAPDGQEVVFTWRKGKGTPDIYFKALDSETLRPFVVSDSIEKGPVFSPNGRYVAFLRVGADRAAIVIKPRDGGPERYVTEISSPHVYMLASPGPYLAWTTDGQGLIYSDNQSLHLWRLDHSRTIRLTDPPHTAVRGDEDPALSPDGKTLVFVRDTQAGRADLYRLPLNDKFEPAGPATLLFSNGSSNRSPAWHPNGKRIIFVSGQWGRQRLWRLDIDSPKAAKPLPGAGSDAQQPAISPVTGDILYTKWVFRQQIWSLELSESAEATGNLEPLLASTRSDILPRFSRDGSQIVFQSDRTGSYEIWIAGTDGSGLRKITSFGGQPAGSPDLSPDGTMVAFDYLVDGQRDIFISDLYGGSMRRLTNDPAEDVVPRWSADGKSVYFASHRNGRSEIWKADAESGRAVQMTTDGGLVAQESPDGKVLYFTQAGGGLPTDLFAMPSGGGAARKVVNGVYYKAMCVTGKGIFYVPVRARDEVRLMDIATGRDRRVVALRDNLIDNLAADSTGRRIVLVLDGALPADLMMIRGTP
jgi:Tol biopolymer transport system component/DNA-binding winged helix-turn-helix (wHTH) protein